MEGSEAFEFGIRNGGRLWVSSRVSEANRGICGEWDVYRPHGAKKGWSHVVPRVQLHL